MKNFLISIRLTVVMIMVCAVLYPLVIAAVAIAALGNGKGETISVNGKVVGYANVGQSFTQDKYFQGRPSAVNYNAAGSGGSNKGSANAEYLKTVQDRIDTLLVHNPTIKKHQIPADLVTASGSGLDPDISPQAARVQLARIAAVRKLPVEKLKALVEAQIQQPLLGPATINVLTLNIALDQLQ